jgi:hypothetical protein
MKKATKFSATTSEKAMLRETVLVPPESVSPSRAMVRTQVYLTRAEHEFLQAESSRRGKPMAAILRAFVDEKMAVPPDAWTNNPMLRPAPAEPGWNPPVDAAINHDHYLYGAPKKWIKVNGQWVEAPPLPEDYYENDASYEAYNQRLRELDESR